MKIIDRPLYINKLQHYRNQNEIKFITGARHCGKTYLLNLFKDHLINDGIATENIVYIDADSMYYPNINLYDIVKQQISQNSKNYLLIDEIHRISDWKADLVALKSNFDIDVYAATSRANIIDYEFCCQLGHRPIEIKVLPLSFKEFSTFTHNIQFEDYVKLGGIPIATMFNSSTKDLFFTSMAQDVLVVNKVSDCELMMSLIKILFTEMGKVLSFNTISKMLKDENPKAPAVRTIENYIKMLTDAHIFYSVRVFDVKDNHNLIRYAKYYPVDLAYRNLFVDSDDMSIPILESIIYFELLRLGVKVSTCKIGNKKIAFLAESEDNKIYIQVTDKLTKDHIVPLRSINDHYSKWILTLDKIYTHTKDGIRISNIIDFLMDE